ncbi:helix-turn-helix domain-containing protein [Kitasatospora paranensis]|uniref:Helix-turn-helix domain-containing protein n=1 Tax=Kitasatospora paranensis TaxID=258053 RepID=A0ABW2FNZ8_9ACTN
MSTTEGGSVRAGPVGPRDTGRRLVARRKQLGLSREEVAGQAGMGTAHLEYLESNRGVVELGTASRLAAALRTSVPDLLGDSGSGPPLPAGRPVMEELESWECWAKLAPRGVGRVALALPDGPCVIPVNYRVLDGTVLYRTTAHSTPAGAAGSTVAFEVDRLDDALRNGWSVLVVGPAKLVTEPEALAWFGEHADPRPWVGDEGRDTWVRISPGRITGRALRSTDAAPPDTP